MSNWGHRVKVCHDDSMLPKSRQSGFFISCWEWLQTSINTDMILRGWTVPSIHGLHMSITWSSHEYYMVFTWSSHGYYMVFTWVSHGLHMDFTWVLHGLHMVFMGITWSSHGYHMVFTWVSHEYHMDFTWVSHGYHMVFTWYKQHGLNMRIMLINIMGSTWSSHG